MHGVAFSPTYARSTRSAEEVFGLLFSLLLLGLLLGFKHALEADHVSTVATLASRSASTKDTLGVAAAWGLGHAAALAAAGSILIALGATLPDRMQRWLEAVVGAILVALGAGVLQRVREKRLHLHAHQHGAERHLHFHSHAEEAGHEHPHRAPLRRRSLLIGGLHGLAGTGAISLLALPATGSPLKALLYLLVFGVGSVFGMVALSLAVSLPLRLSARRLGRIGLALEGLLGVADVAIGGFILSKLVS